MHTSHVNLISCLLISTVTNLSSFFFSCAVRNTPKYKEVKATGKGKVVSRMWLEKCYDLKKYLPWRRFALDPHDQKCPESDEEIMEDRRAPNPNDDIPSCSKNVQQGVKDKETQQLVVNHLSDPDTEDELERVAQSNVQHNLNVQKY